MCLLESFLSFVFGTLGNVAFSFESYQIKGLKATQVSDDTEDLMSFQRKIICVREKFRPTFWSEPELQQKTTTPQDFLHSIQSWKAELVAQHFCLSISFQFKSLVPVGLVYSTPFQAAIFSGLVSSGTWRWPFFHINKIPKFIDNQTPLFSLKLWQALLSVLIYHPHFKPRWFLCRFFLKLQILVIRGSLLHERL